MILYVTFAQQQGANSLFLSLERVKGEGFLENGLQSEVYLMQAKRLPAGCLGLEGYILIGSVGIFTLDT